MIQFENKALAFAKQTQRQKLVNVAEISYADIMKLKPLLTAAGIDALIPKIVVCLIQKKQANPI
jgi:hypothetical protein